MPTELSTSLRPTRAQLLAAFGGDPLSVESLLDFCSIPVEALARLASLAGEEDWGEKDFVLLKCLAVQLRLAIEQGRYVWNGAELVLRAGNLGSAGGEELYLGLVRGEETPWLLERVGERPPDCESLEAADLSVWPVLDPSREVVIACDLAFLRAKLGALAGLSLIAQNAALTGAVVWALRRGHAVRQVHGQSRGYFLPVYLTRREGAPDLVAPIQVQSRRLVVRTLLDPHSAYAPARAVVERREQLAPWLIAAWQASEEDAPAAAAATAPDEA